MGIIGIIPVLHNLCQYKFAYLRQSQIVSHVCFAIEIKPLKPRDIKGPCFPLLTLFCFSIPSVSKVSESYLPLVCFSLRQINTCQ